MCSRGRLTLERPAYHLNTYGMSSPVDACALLSIARGCGFAALATCCGMVSLAFDPAAAFKFGGYSGLLACSVLLLKAYRSPAVAYKRTETWLILPEEYRPPEPVAQLIIGRARQRALYVFARVTAGFSAFCFVAAFLSRAYLGP